MSYLLTLLTIFETIFVTKSLSLTGFRITVMFLVTSRLGSITEYAKREDKLHKLHKYHRDFVLEFVDEVLFGLTIRFKLREHEKKLVNHEPLNE